MNIEFHYFTIYALALEAGFDERSAFIIANSSQEVDASITSLKFDCQGELYEIPITQNYIFWDEKVQRQMYMPFHFVPGDSKLAAKMRVDGKENRYAVTENSENAKSLLIDALKSKNLYSIGIALHAFADTFAHQNFCALTDSYNSVNNSSFMAALPPAGHLQALSNPDEVGNIWDDFRLKPEYMHISNYERYIRAAKKIFRYLCIFKNKDYAIEELVLDRIKKIWLKHSKQERMMDYQIEWNIEPYKKNYWRLLAGAPKDNSPLSDVMYYDKISWAKHQFDIEVPVVKTDTSFYTTDLYYWTESIHQHIKRANKIFEKENL